jgi:hypothetical protein
VEWRRLKYKELYDLYSPPNIIWAIISRMRWVGHMECRGGTGNMYTGIWWGDLMEQDHLEELGIDGTIL